MMFKDNSFLQTKKLNDVTLLGEGVEYFFDIHWGLVIGPPVNETASVLVIVIGPITSTVE